MSNRGKRNRLSLETRLRDAHIKGTGTRLEAHEVKRIIDALRPAPVASGGQHSSATDFLPDDVLACVPVAETAGEIGRNITFSPFDLDTGNAVVSPQEPDGPYWTLIAQGGEAEQNRIAAEIVRRLNAPVPAQDDDKLRIADADAKWLTRLLGDQKESGHCGEGNVERRERSIWNDRIDRILAALKSTAAQEGGSK